MNPTLRSERTHELTGCPSCFHQASGAILLEFDYLLVLWRDAGPEEEGTRGEREVSAFSDAASVLMSPSQTERSCLKGQLKCISEYSKHLLLPFIPLSADVKDSIHSAGRRTNTPPPPPPPPCRQSSSTFAPTIERGQR